VGILGNISGREDMLEYRAEQGRTTVSGVLARVMAGQTDAQLLRTDRLREHAVRIGTIRGWQRCHGVVLLA
jgi:hypothetical protein